MKNGAADHIFDVLLHFISEKLVLCNDYPLDEVAEKLVNVWPSMAVAVTLMRKILSQSDEPTRDSIMQVVMSYPSIFQDLFMIYEIGTHDTSMYIKNVQYRYEDTMLVQF